MANRERYFAIDMMSFVANKYNIDWIRQEEQETPSPFTVLNKIGINIYLKETNNAMVSIFQQCHGSRLETDFRSFIQRVVVFPSRRMLKRVFVACIQVARYATLFYTNGALGAPDVAIEIIYNILRETAQNEEDDIFGIFELHCLDLTISQG